MSHILFFFFNDTATTEIYTLSLHDALPICRRGRRYLRRRRRGRVSAPGSGPRPCLSNRGRVLASRCRFGLGRSRRSGRRSEEHTSELQSRQYLVCRLLLEKKKNQNQL